ncbi:hypothetical protein DRO27_03795 [Candidatus Bathyarchaeota archaeon]|nr:MAG: hypothetical protein DRO27_03795 [Candidatus Bathyarchaeota archaeon]
MKIKWNRWNMSLGTEHYATQPDAKNPYDSVASIRPQIYGSRDRAVVVVVGSVGEGKALVEHLAEHGYIGEGKNG